MLLPTYINTQYFSLKFWGGGRKSSWGGILGCPPLYEDLPIPVISDVCLGDHVTVLFSSQHVYMYKYCIYYFTSNMVHVSYSTYVYIPPTHKQTVVTYVTLCFSLPPSLPPSVFGAAETQPPVPHPP